MTKITRTAVALVILAGTGSSPAAELEDLDLGARLTDALYDGQETVPLGGPMYCGKNKVLYDPRVGWRHGATPETHGARCTFVFENVRLVPIDVVYSEIRSSALPDTVETRTLSYDNCRGTEGLKPNDSFTVTVREGVSLSKSTTIRVDKNVNWNNSVVFTIGIFGITAGNQKTVTYSAQTVADEKLDFTTDRTDATFLNTIEVKPGTIHEVRTTKKTATDFVEYTGVAAVEADVYMEPIGILSGAPGRKFKLGRLSDLVVGRKPPTVNLRGRIWNVRAERIGRIDVVRSCDKD